MLIPNIQLAYSENIITIIPCSSNHDNAKFFDMPFYFINKGQSIRWNNADDIDHRLIITNSSNDRLLSDSGIIKPNGSFSFKFNNMGVYHFSSPVYHWMQGNVFVTNNVSSITAANLKDNVEVQLSWTPSVPKAGEIAYFQIVFIDEKTGKNQPHVDYVFSIDSPENKTLYQQALHSSWGTESSSYMFKKGGPFTSRLTVDAILFQPIEPIETDFKVPVRS
jgi:hypothetical protein